MEKKKERRGLDEWGYGGKWEGGRGDGPVNTRAVQ